MKRIKWSKEEYLWMITRYYNCYYENLIKLGQETETEEWEKELELFKKEFENERNLNSIRMFIGNLNFLAVEEIRKHNNPYNVNLNISNIYSNGAKPAKKMFEEQKVNFPEINKLLNTV